jgi:uncharacterized protein
MDYLQILLLVAVGIVAGMINILAGGGSLLTLPVLIFLGLPPQVANGTNRIAIFAQNIVAVNSFSRGGKLPLKLALLCTPSALVSFFGIGVYGGFIQAGVGFLIITALLAHGLDLVRINAVKVFVVLFFTGIALVVFVKHGQVDIRLGPALAVGNSIGGWLGARLAISKGHGFIRKSLFVVIAVFAIRLYWQ